MSDRLSKFLVIQTFIKNQVHVVGACIVVIVMEAAGIDEDRIDAAEALCLYIHQRCESFNTSCDMDSQRIGGIIAAVDQQGIE